MNKGFTLWKMLPMLVAVFGFFQANTQHIHTTEICGTSVESQAAQKERMFENRRNRESLMQEFIEYKQARNGANTISYVPVYMHIAGESDGSGYADIERVLQTICTFNSDYADQNIQFYLSGWQFVPNPLIYDHGTSSGDATAQYAMSLYKVPDALNIFIGRNVSGSDEFLAYYTRFLDIVYTFKSGLGAGNPTLTHELGHFFTLPHTFFGWEGTNYINESVNGKAPELVGGVEVEKVARNVAGENCQIAADGFCDTPPDYSSDRAPCPQTAAWYDPDSVLIDPTEDNFMSYFFDACMSTFSNDQKDAILLDFVSRGYHLLPTPSPLLVQGTPTLDWPANGSLAGNPSAVELRWNKADSADLYLVKVDKVIGGAGINQVTRLVGNVTSLWVSLDPNATYRWSVEAMTKYELCANAVSTQATFTTADWTVDVSNIAPPISGSKVYPNPMSSGDNQLVVEIEASANMEAQVRIFNQLGQVVMPNQQIQLQNGKNRETFQTVNLAAGMYMVEIQTAQEKITHKLIVQD
jgi:hypothetical protein